MCFREMNPKVTVITTMERRAAIGWIGRSVGRCQIKAASPPDLTSSKGLLDSPLGVSLTELKTNLNVALVLLGRTRRVERSVGYCIARLHNSVLEQILLDFFAADIDEHFLIDLDAGGKWLPAFRFHLPAKSRIRDDVLL